MDVPISVLFTVILAVLATQSHGHDPMKIAFRARWSAKGDNPISRGGDILNFPVLELNAGGGYNDTTGIFTCPMTGIYLFSIHLMRAYPSKSDRTYCQFHLRVNREVVQHILIGPSRLRYVSDSATTVACCRSGQPVWVEMCSCSKASECNLRNAFNSFSGAMIHAFPEKDYNGEVIDQVLEAAHLPLEREPNVEVVPVDVSGLSQEEGREEDPDPEGREQQESYIVPDTELAEKQVHKLSSDYNQQQIGDSYVDENSMDENDSKQEPEKDESEYVNNIGKLEDNQEHDLVTEEPVQGGNDIHIEGRKMEEPSSSMEETWDSLNLDEYTDSMSSEENSNSMSSEEGSDSMSSEEGSDSQSSEEDLDAEEYEELLEAIKDSQEKDEIIEYDEDGDDNDEDGDDNGEDGNNNSEAGDDNAENELEGEEPIEATAEALEVENNPGDPGENEN